MFLVQFLLPLSDNLGQRFTSHEFTRVHDELTERFGGITAYMRSPAVGLWKEQKDNTQRVSRDNIVMFEVMVESLDRPWWSDYRESLKQRFRQEEVIIRATQMERL